MIKVVSKNATRERVHRRIRRRVDDQRRIAQRLAQHRVRLLLEELQPAAHRPPGVRVRAHVRAGPLQRPGSSQQEHARATAEVAALDAAAKAFVEVGAHLGIV